jgi:hypothetical protein
VARWRFTNVTKSETFWPLLADLNIEDHHPHDLATISATLVDVEASLEFDLKDELLVEYAEDGTSFEIAFAGDLNGRELTDMGRSDPRVWRIEGQDFTTRLEDTVLTGTRPPETAAIRLGWIMGVTPTQDLTLADVSALTTMLDEHDEYGGMNKREALDEIAQELDATFYATFEKEVHFFVGTEAYPAPFDLVHPASPPASYPYWNFSLADDGLTLGTRVWVEGATAGLWRINTTAETELGRVIERSINDTELVTTGQMERAGDTFLANSYPAPREGQLTLIKPGIRSGMQVHVTHPSWIPQGVDDDFEVTGVVVKMLDPNADDPTGGGQAEWTVTIADRVRRSGGAAGVINTVTRRRTTTIIDTGGGDNIVGGTACEGVEDFFTDWDSNGLGLPDGWSLVLKGEGASINGGQYPGAWDAPCPCPAPTIDGYAYFVNGMGFLPDDPDGSAMADWLISPRVILRNGGQIRFWALGNTTADEWQVRLGMGCGISLLDGTFRADTGDPNDALDAGQFSTLVGATGPLLDSEFTQFTYTISGLAAPVVGYLAWVLSIPVLGTNHGAIGLCLTEYDSGGLEPPPPTPRWEPFDTPTTSPEIGPDWTLLYDDDYYGIHYTSESDGDVWRFTSEAEDIGGGDMWPPYIAYEYTGSSFPYSGVDSTLRARVKLGAVLTSDHVGGNITFIRGGFYSGNYASGGLSISSDGTTRPSSYHSGSSGGSTSPGGPWPIFDPDAWYLVEWEWKPSEGINRLTLRNDEGDAIQTHTASVGTGMVLDDEDALFMDISGWDSVEVDYIDWLV